jgi:hypothetical protein
LLHSDVHGLTVDVRTSLRKHGRNAIVTGAASGAMTIVWPIIVSARYIVTTMSAQSSLSAGLFQKRRGRGALDPR